MDLVSGVLGVGAVPPEVGVAFGGVFGELGGVGAVFYRDSAGLVLRVGETVIGVGAGVVAEWELSAGFARFALVIGAEVLFETWYRGGGGEGDIGVFVRDVLADPGRRERVFGGGGR
ncbi:hypothetical protein GFY24_21965 [Nocardia sp. SYP-A9097]|nr:hypothetical protein [Nocardia sp. SYP-A9097]